MRRVLSANLDLITQLMPLLSTGGLHLTCCLPRPKGVTNYYAHLGFQFGWLIRSKQRHNTLTKLTLNY